MNCGENLDYGLGSPVLFLLLNAKVVYYVLVFLDYDRLLLVVSFRTDLISLNYRLALRGSIFSRLYLECLVSFTFQLEHVLIWTLHTYQPVVAKLLAFSLS